MFATMSNTYPGCLLQWVIHIPGVYYNEQYRSLEFTTMSNTYPGCLLQWVIHIPGVYYND